MSNSELEQISVSRLGNRNDQWWGTGDTERRKKMKILDTSIRQFKFSIKNLYYNKIVISVNFKMCK